MGVTSFTRFPPTQTYSRPSHPFFFAKGDSKHNSKSDVSILSTTVDAIMTALLNPKATTQLTDTFHIGAVLRNKNQVAIE